MGRRLRQLQRQVQQAATLKQQAMTRELQRQVQQEARLKMQPMTRQWQNAKTGVQTAKNIKISHGQRSANGTGALRAQNALRRQLQRQVQQAATLKRQAMT